MKYAAIIVAGGSGKRMGGDIPKQFLPLGGKPVLMHTVGLFYAYNPEMYIVIVLPEAHLSTWNDLCRQYSFSTPHTVIAGGKERFFSVRNALSLLPDDIDIVAVHDGVRPLASRDTLARSFAEAENSGAAVPAVAVVDSLRRIDADGGSRAVNRAEYKAVQTPQCFKASILKAAYNADFSPSFTDDASVVEASGHKVSIVDGNPENLKITTPTDFVIAEHIYRNKTKNRGRFIN